MQRKSRHGTHAAGTGICRQQQWNFFRFHNIYVQNPNGRKDLSASVQRHPSFIMASYPSFSWSPLSCSRPPPLQYFSTINFPFCKINRLFKYCISSALSNIPDRLTVLVSDWDKGLLFSVFKKVQFKVKRKILWPNISFGYPIKTDPTDSFAFLPGSINIREDLEFAFSIWIS